MLYRICTELNALPSRVPGGSTVLLVVRHHVALTARDAVPLAAS